MRVLISSYELCFTLFILMATGLFVPQTAFCQTEKLGSVKYTPPKGWNKTEKENIIAFSSRNQTTGGFCVITLYGATSSVGTPEKDFTKEWDNLVIKPLKGEANPKTETESADGWTVIAGGSAIEFQGSQALALLTVISGFGKTVSVLGVLNDQTCLTPLQAFATGIQMDKTTADNPVPLREESSAPAADAAAMHVAALVKEFETNEVRANQVWVGKRVRVYGTVNSIEIGKDGNIVLTFKSSISTYNNGRCFFNKSQSSRVATLNAHQEATVEGTVRGLGGGFDNSKAFLLLENCIVP